MQKITFHEAIKDHHIVRVVNRVFHDVEAQTYVERHPEIYTYESAQWQELMTPLVIDYKRTHKSITLLDIGTGIGFVPASIGNVLSKEDTVVFSDISTHMLEKAKEYSENLAVQRIFKLVDEQYSNITTASIDMVTMNSVLHHIPDVSHLSSQIDRLLKPGGLLIIKHEPNVLFGQSYILSALYVVLKKMRGTKKATSPEPDIDVITKQVTSMLETEEHIVFTPALTKKELQQIVDIHSPTAGGELDSKRGFNPQTFQSEFFPGYVCVRIRTYGYFGKIRDDTGPVRKCLSAILTVLLPHKGYFFDFVIKKSE